MTNTMNPFLTEYHTPYHTTPFHLIRMEHYEPAMLQGMEEHNKEIEAIIQNPDEPSFSNTIVALEKSGELLNRVSTVFGNFNTQTVLSCHLRCISSRCGQIYIFFFQILSLAF